jgi:hypothetical protein
VAAFKLKTYTLLCLFSNSVGLWANNVRICCGSLGHWENYHRTIIQNQIQDQIQDQVHIRVTIKPETGKNREKNPAGLGRGRGRVNYMVGTFVPIKSQIKNFTLFSVMVSLIDSAYVNNSGISLHGRLGK